MRPIVLIAMLMVPLLWAGCIEDDGGCRPSGSGELSLSASIDGRGYRMHRITYGCEAETETYPIERYLFVIHVPAVPDFTLELSSDRLVGPDQGDFTVLLDENGTFRTDAGRGPTWTLFFSAWEADTARRARPAITITWDGPDAGGSWDPRPMGWYNVTVRLRDDASERFATTTCYECEGHPLAPRLRSL